MRLFRTFNEFVRLVRSDLDRFTSHARALSRSGAARFRITLDTLLFKAGFQCVFLFRLGHWFYQNGLIFMARICMRLNHAWTGADIGFASEIGKELMISHPVGVVIGHRTRIGDRATLLGGVLFGVKSWTPELMDKLPVAGNNCVFCAKSSILGDCKVGDNVVVGINAVVDMDVEPDAYVTGSSPAVIVPGKGKELIRSWVL